LKASIELAKVIKVLGDKVKSWIEIQGGLLIYPDKATFDVLFVTRRYELQMMDYRWSFAAFVMLQETLDECSMEVLEKLRKMECWTTLEVGFSSLFRKKYRFSENPLLRRRGIVFDQAPRLLKRIGRSHEETRGNEPS